MLATSRERLAWETEVNLDQHQLLALGRLPIPHPHPQGGKLCPWRQLEAAWTQLGGTRMGTRDAVLQIPGFCALIAAASDHRGTNEELGSHCCKILPLSWSDCQDFSTGWPLSHIPSPPFFLFSPFGSQTLKTRSFKNIYYIGKILKQPRMFRERLRKDPRKP